MRRMSRHVSETPATAFLKRHGVAYTEHPYEYEEHGGTRVSARALGVDEYVVVKTLVMEDEKKQPLIVLMHGDRTVSTKNLARQAARKSIEPCRPEVAQRHTGYLVGGTVALRHAQGDAGVRGKDDPRPRADLHQRRTSRLSRRHRPERAGAGA